MMHLGRLAALILTLCLLLPVVAAEARPLRAPIVVATSTSILKDLVSNVAGDLVEVIQVVPTGTEPHEFQPSPADAIAVSRATVFFANGLNYELFLRRLIQNSGNRELRTVTLSDGLRVVGKGGINAQYQDAGNPHLWLNARNAMAYVETIRDTLAEIDPDHAATYLTNAERYLTELDTLDQEILARISTIPAGNRKLVTFHDSFPYYCDRYGLENFAVITLAPESEPSAFEYAVLVDRIRSNGVRALFGEVGFSSKVVQQLAEDTGARFVAGLYSDTIGTTPDTESYVKIMRSNTSLIVDNLR